MARFMRTLIVISVTVAISIAYVMGCGGGSSSSRSINLGGVVMAPTVSGNIALPPKGGHPRENEDLVNTLDSRVCGNDKNMSIAKAAPAESAVQTTCHAYTTRGDDLGNFTTGADGAFSITVSLNTLKSSDDTGTTWDEPVIIDCQNGVQLYSNVSVNEDAISDKDLGTLNFQTTLAALAVAGNISGFSGWGVSYAEELSAYDTACLSDVMTALWNDSALSGEGLADDNGVIKETVMALFATGAGPADYGYASWQDLILAILGKTISEANWAAISAATASTLGVSEATLTGYYATLNGAFTSVNSLLTSQFASGAYGATNICDNIKDDTLASDAFIKPMLAADTTAAFASTYAVTAGIMGYFGILEKCVTLGNCTELAGKPGSYYGFLNSYAQNNTFASLWDGTNFSSEAVEGTLRAAAACGGTTVSAMEDCGRGMYGTVYDGAGSWSSFMSGGAFVDDLFAFWGGYYTGAVTDGTFVATTLYYQTAWDEYNAYMDHDAIVDCVEALYAAGNYDTSPCYGDIAQGTSPYPASIAGGYYYDYLSMDGGCDFPGSMTIGSPFTFTAVSATTYTADITVASQTAQFACTYSSDTGIADCDYAGGGAGLAAGDYIDMYLWNSGAEKAAMFIGGRLQGGLYYCTEDANYQGRVYSTQ